MLNLTNSLSTPTNPHKLSFYLRFAMPLTISLKQNERLLNQLKHLGTKALYGYDSKSVFVHSKYPYSKDRIVSKKL